jgi:NAD(P)H dehydrogenase (quinone)
MAMKVLVPFYSLYGHIYKMAQAVAEGASQVKRAQVELRRVPETLSDEVLEKMGAVIFGTPTRFGNMCGQMRQFLDATGKLWLSGALVGKVGSVFTSSNTQHGGQETTITSFHLTLHLGLVVVGLPYAFEGQMRMDEITGGSPYGASTIAGSAGKRQPSDNELDAARFQGNHVAAIAKKLAK